jgi:hypothetical protein
MNGMDIGRPSGRSLSAAIDCRVRPAYAGLRLHRRPALAVFVIAWLGCLSGITQGTAPRGSHQTAKIVVAVDPTPGFVLTLAPMLREWPGSQLLAASDANQAAVGEYLRRYPDAEVWAIESGDASAKTWNRPVRSFHGGTAKVLGELRTECWPQPSEVILANAADKPQAMLGCLLATARRAPLYLVDPKKEDASWPQLPSRSIRRVTCIGAKEAWLTPPTLREAEWSYVTDSDGVQSAYTRSLGSDRTDHLVVVNPAGPASGTKDSGLACLAVPYALRHRAAVLIASAGDDLDGRIAGILRRSYPQVRYVTILGDEASLPLSRVPDPATSPAAAGQRAGGPQSAARAEPAEHVEDSEYDQATGPAEAKPASPAGGQAAPKPEPPKLVAAELLGGVTLRRPCTYRVGRITGDSLASASLLAANGDPLARPPASATLRGWMMTNVGSKPLPLLECIARATEGSFAAHGWQVAAYYGAHHPPTSLETFLAADFVVYQGHTADLGEFTKASQRAAALRPGLFLLQGCVSLQQEESQSLVRRGAAGVVGTTANMYSASGGAFTKAFVDALLDGNDAGTSLMIARNYTFALSLLKEKRGHEQSGKPLRAAMTFGLWGDPTWKPPGAAGPLPASDRLSAVRKGSRIELHVPVSWPGNARAGKYVAAIPLSGELAGMYAATAEQNGQRQLVPLYFAVVPLEDRSGAEPPRLSSKLPDADWVSLWDPSNRWLYLLVRGKTANGKDPGRVYSFQVR